MEESNQPYLRLDNNQSREDEGAPLPLWRKLCFAIGGAPYQITSTVISFFLNIFLLEVALLQPRYVSIILFSGKAWDAITDPTIGLLVQRTNTRWGKMRPWILFSGPAACATYFLLFYVPWDIEVGPDGKETILASDGAKLGFYFAMFCLFEGFLSCLHVPYTALTMYVSSNQRDRDSITAIRMGFEALGVLIAVIVQGSFVSDTRCKGDEEIGHNATSLIVQRDAYMHGSFVVVGLYMLCCCTVFFGSKEKRGLVDDQKAHHVGFFKGIKLVFTFKPYLYASLTFLFLTIAIQIIQGNVALFCTHTLKMGEDFTYFILVLLCVSIAALPFWQFIALKFGKKSAYAAGMMLMIPLLIALLYIPPNVKWPFYVVMVLSGLGISVALLLPWSVLPDVIDLYTLENQARHDAMFYSFYVFFNKFAAGLALAISQVALEFGGYVSGDCTQPDSVGETLRWLMTPGPVVLILCALIALWKYPIDENKRKLIRSKVTEFVVDKPESSSSIDLEGNEVSQGYDNTLRKRLDSESTGM